MTKLLAATLLAAGLLAAQTPALARNAQHERMAACNTEAGAKKGADRKVFMKTCLTDKRNAQQQKMVSCNKEAAGKKGADRKAFMSACLSK